MCGIREKCHDSQLFKIQQLDVSFHKFVNIISLAQATEKTELEQSKVLTSSESLRITAFDSITQ